MPDVSSIPFKQADPNGHYRSKQLPNDSGDFMQMLGLPAFAGDVVGPGGATTGQAVVFSDATGKRIDAATQTGLAKLTGGVLSSVAAPVGDVVGTTDPQTLTNKTLINPTLSGVTGFDKDDVGLGNVDNTADTAKPVSGPQQAALDLKEDKNKKGVANGYASLDASTKIPLAQIPDSVVGASQYQGTWNATTNVPAIPAAAIGNKGWYYSVAVAGTTNINGISSWAVGDEIISNGSVWQKIVNVSAVNSVNGYTGTVVLGKGDIGLGNVDNTSDAAKPVSAATVTQLNLKEDKSNKNVANGYAGLDATGKVPAANVPADLVTSVAAKQGVVTLVKGDVGLGNVDNTSDATKNAAAVTLTNHTINGAANTLTVRLANDVTGNLPVANLNSGTGANSGSFWRGDGQWAPPAGGGDVVGPAGAVDSDVAVFNGATGKIIKTTGKPIGNLVTGPASAVANDVVVFDGTSGKLVKTTGRQVSTLGTGDVVGPATSVDAAMAVFNGTTGKIIKVPTAAELDAIIKPIVGSVRLNSFNSVGNPSFEVDQMNCGVLEANNTASFACDRWRVSSVGTMRFSTQQTVATPPIVCPGTSFNVTNNYVRCTLTTAQGSLGVNDYWALGHSVEGSSARELYNNVHSVQVLVRSSVADLKFAVALQDEGGTWSLTKLCTLGAANTWTLITLPNLPVWTGSATFPTAPGSVGYRLRITLAAGTTVTAAPDVWGAGNKVGATGMDNFASKPTSSTFDVAFVQHEPGNTCTTLIDKPWTQNYDECLRYYCKSYGYTVVPGTPGLPGAIGHFVVVNATTADGVVMWPKRMAKTPSSAVTYNPSTGGINAGYNGNNGGNVAMGVYGATEVGFMALTASAMTIGHVYIVHYVADTQF